MAFLRAFAKLVELGCVRLSSTVPKQFSKWDCELCCALFQENIWHAVSGFAAIQGSQRSQYALHTHPKAFQFCFGILLRWLLPIIIVYIGSIAHLLCKMRN